MGRWLVRWWRMTLVVTVCAAIYVIILGGRIYAEGLRDERGRADVIIVLGAAQANGRPMAIFLGRLEHALTLYGDGYAPYLLFTGGSKPGDNFTEAATGRRYALRHGVPVRAILLEPNGHTTKESLRACRDIMQQRGLRRAILVSDPFHTFRLRMMARELGLRAVVSPTPSSRVRSFGKQLHFILREVGVYTVGRLTGG